MELPWPLPDRTDLRDRLVTAYGTDRGYHDLRHLAEVLGRLEELGAAGNVEVMLAAWFHDAVYDAAGDNEERSARLAEQELAGSDVDVAEVARLVRLTEHHKPAPDDANGAALTDADLGILAASPRRYAEYADDVRTEYAHVSDEDFRQGRLAILESLAAKPTLFHTPYAREHWEATARANLAAEIISVRG
jgi:predicted metal-dependent HD superfamily phosphohydrolase